MSFDLHIQFNDQSPEASALQSLISRDRVSAEEVVRRLVLKEAATHDPDNYDHIFTPELITKLEAAEDEARIGNNMTIEQVTTHFEMKRQAWNANHRA